mmetsp:Transcript_21727/g.47520  ORF Transcript_21727/g.47520 Transcript_21727/m.47520 type:complete len:223 (+) Transcript_21727:363-1031(+)
MLLIRSLSLLTPPTCTGVVSCSSSAITSDFGRCRCSNRSSCCCSKTVVCGAASSVGSAFGCALSIGSAFDSASGDGSASRSASRVCSALGSVASVGSAVVPASGSSPTCCSGLGSAFAAAFASALADAENLAFGSSSGSCFDSAGLCSACAPALVLHFSLSAFSSSCSSRPTSFSCVLSIRESAKKEQFFPRFPKSCSATLSSKSTAGCAALMGVPPSTSSA